MLANRPAMKLGILFIIGIIIGSIVSCSLLITGITLLITALLYVVLLIVKKEKLISLRSIIFVMMVLLFGVCKITFDAAYVEDNRVSNFVAADRTVSLTGKIIDLPRVSGQSIQFVIESERIEFEHQYRVVTGGVLVSCPNTEFIRMYTESLHYGRTLTLSGELALASMPRNPGEFDFRKYLELNNIYARVQVESLDSHNLREEARYNFLSAFVYPVRRSVADRLDMLIGGEEAKFLKGLIIGERSEIPIEVKTAFINAGVMHILAVSGLHVAIVAMILIVILQMIRIPERTRIILTCLLLMYYNYLTGASASVARSVIMAIVFLSSKLVERQADMYNTLFLSALVLLVIDSKQLFQAGFQLSFVAVLSLVYLYPKIFSLKDFLPERVRNNRFVYGFIAAISVSLAAGIGTLPFTSMYFGKISVASFAANIIIVPLSNIILALGMVAVAISYISFSIAGYYADAASLLTKLLLALVSYFGNLPHSYIDSHLSIQSSLIFYAGVILLISCLKKELRKTALISGLVIANIYLYGLIIFSVPEKNLKTTFIDVGQGDAIFVQCPNGKNILVDAGPLTNNNDAGERFIAPFLRRQNISRLDAVIVSHPHSDHLGGVPYLLKNFEIGEVIDAGSFGNSELFRNYLHLIDSLNIRRVICRAGDMIEGFDNLRLYGLHPSGSFVPSDSEGHVNFNNQSLVIKLQYGRTSLLLSGDAEKESEERIEYVYGDFLQCTMLKAGHHGSITSSTVEYLRLIDPEIAVISVGRKNKFHHPSPEVLERLQSLGCRLLRTDESGAVIFESNGEHWSFVNWR